jgi:hypothetical protein
VISVVSLRRHEVAHFLHCPALFRRHIARARWYHRIHLIPGWLLRRWCDQFDRDLLAEFDMPGED